MHVLHPPVHLHARGEQRVAAPALFAGPGSPPRPWGACDPAQRGQGAQRFTPTPVGSRGRLKTGRGSCAVHPHARGEQSTRIASWPRLVGSPPRPWGAAYDRKVTSQLARFTPTPVGSSRPIFAGRYSNPVHPHARGEQQGSWRRGANDGGSPPRPWGADRAGVGDRPHERFTPTPVGSSFVPS